MKKGIFSGNLSTDVAGDSRWKISRSGFCGMRSKKVNTESQNFILFIF